jgi:trans-aconitate 2-methyltransferase
VSDAVDWDADEYDRLAELPHEAWAREVLSRLDLEGDETVLDAGCGTGRMLGLLREQHEGLTLIGADGSPAMLERARKNLGEGIELITRDLVELELREPVDVVVSNAVFHWISDHQRLFDRLYASLKPGGRLEAQCGGYGNVDEIQRTVEALAGDERFAPYLRTERRPWNYASVGDTELRLARAGFRDVRAWLEPWQVQPRDAHRYLATVVLPWHLARLPEELHDDFVNAVIGSSTRPMVISYVRLNISATRPA